MQKCVFLFQFGVEIFFSGNNFYSNLAWKYFSVEIFFSGNNFYSNLVWKYFSVEIIFSIFIPIWCGNNFQ
jgi:hypothetical protein